MTRTHLFKSRIAPVYFVALLIMAFLATPHAAEAQLARRVKDINTTSFAAASFPSNPVQIGNITYFGADDGIDGAELWRTDGTPAGTWLVKDIRPGRPPSNAGPFIRLNGSVIFLATDETRGRELFRSNGTADGTVLLKLLPAWQTPSSLTASGNFVFFVATDGVNGSELWRTDGTAAGTVMVKDIRPGPASGIDVSAGFSPSLSDINGTLYFMADDGATGMELWKSDGSAAGTVRVKDINPGAASSMPTAMLALNGMVFFRAIDGVNGSELWRTDGTEGGTVMVKDIRLGPANSVPQVLTASGGVLYFTANDGITG